MKSHCLWFTPLRLKLFSTIFLITPQCTQHKSTANKITGNPTAHTTPSILLTQFWKQQPLSFFRLASGVAWYHTNLENRRECEKMHQYTGKENPTHIRRISVPQTVPQPKQNPQAIQCVVSGYKHFVENPQGFFSHRGSPPDDYSVLIFRCPSVVRRTTRYCLHKGKMLIPITV